MTVAILFALIIVFCLIYFLLPQPLKTPAIAIFIALVILLVLYWSGILGGSLNTPIHLR